MGWELALACSLAETTLQDLCPASDSLTRCAQSRTPSRGPALHERRSGRTSKSVPKARLNDAAPEANT